ncbi:TolC family outer membrane protein [Sulfuritalea sp.]|uniref:TolC family outer membrane protein n=1 Tax=Sulfuritalea sp. TaxID=2480090 RepID=UPI001ACFB1DC|nr:TolC family outer membrane protein [Sulfuritalea sp.]MBN8474542.1 TolC family outer membrane protein [Sulfuritalea sp.]
MALANPHLTLKDVAQKVVLTNPEVLAKWHAFKAAGGDVDVARAAFFPRIDYTYGTSKEELKQPGAADRDYNRNGHTLTLNQMLYDGFATVIDVKRQGKARLTRYFELLDAAEVAALEAGRAYYDVIRYRQLMLLAEGNYVEHRSSYELLLRRAQSGAGRRVDVEHAAGRLALAELNLNTEAANLHDVTARYLRLVGERPPPVMFGLARLEKDYPASEEEALRQAFKRNPTLRAAVENVEATQHELELQRSAFHPRLDLRLRSDRADNVDGVMGLRQQKVAELVFSYNLFKGGADTARLTTYAERKNQALDLRDKACRDIRQTLSIAYNEVHRLQAQRSSIDHQVTAIEKTRDAYKAQFNIGQRSLLDLLDTENELLTARRTAVNADVDIDLAYLRTQAGIGRLLEFLGLKRIDEQEAPDSGELAPIVESDICPPAAPKGYLVDIEALTARALAQLDAVKPVPDQTPPPLPTPPAARPASPQTPGNVQERVVAWAAAWSSKSFALYAGFYALSFEPADGSSRASWAQQREQRLAAAKRIQVEVRNLKLKEVGNDMLLAEFEQHYSSDNYSDVTLKELKWVKVGGQWLIARETTRPAATARKKGDT